MPRRWALKQTSGPLGRGVWWERVVRAGRLGPNLLGLGDQVGGLGVTPRAGGASQRASSRGATESDLLFAKLILSACGVPAEMVEAGPGYPRRDEEGS